jgi:hypothetical protein
MGSGNETLGAGGTRCRSVRPGTECSLKRKMGINALLILLKLFVFFSEPLDTAGRIHQFLFPGEKRVAFGANFHADILFRRSNLYDVAAGTLDGCIEIFRMNIGFHCDFNPL